MRRLTISILVTALSVAVAAGAIAAQATGTIGPRTTVTVTPARGTPTTTFTARFTTPFATGSSHGLRSWEIASAVDHGPGGPSCTSNLAVRLQPAGAHQRVSATLSGAGSWCTGTYAGMITLYRVVVCGPPVSRGTVCPEIAFAPEPIGRFRFTVAAGAS